MKQLILVFIKIYQATLSPDHGFFRGRYPYGYCRFYPSCSQYMAEAVDRYGVVKGVGLGVGRVFRCRPDASPAVDKP